MTERTTPRLNLRRLVPDDLDFLFRLHSDEATYRHAPLSRHGSREQTEKMLLAKLAHWEARGFGNWIAEEREGQTPIGIVGVESIRVTTGSEPTEGHQPVEGLNLYYRFTAQSGGKGLGREGAREATAFAADWLSDLPCTAVARPVNVASIKTAEAAGLINAGRTRANPDADAPGPSVLLESPAFEVITDPTDAYDELLDLWGRVNAAGGAVGFMGPTTDEQVRPIIERHLESMDRGRSWLGALRHPGNHALLGYAFWQLNEMPQMAHVGWLQRLMIDPALGGRNLGRILVGRMHALGRSHDLEISRLTYRGGTGLGTFYQRCGYQEVGRVPGALRFDTDRDDVEMATRLDARPLR